MLASVLGCSACGEELNFTLGALVLGLGNGGDPSLGVRLLGMSSCVMSLLCCYCGWLEKHR